MTWLVGQEKTVKYVNARAKKKNRQLFRFPSSKSRRRDRPLVSLLRFFSFLL